MNSGGSSSSGSGPSGPSCAGMSSSQLISLFESTRVRGWNRASDVRLVPIRVCPELRRQVAQWLANNRDYHRMIGAVASDALINAALSRSRYQPGHVLGVQHSGNSLTVFVF